MPHPGLLDIAIVGIGCRLPGHINTPVQFWRLLCDGGDAVTEMPRARFDLDALFDADPHADGKMYTRWGGFVEPIDAFDADFFGISPREARRVDPQQRLLLEVAWEALEDAGHVPERLAGSNTGVFIGISTHDYVDAQVLSRHRGHIDAHTNSGAATSIAANRISYLFDLRGPSLAVDTACSSSLTAVHLACRSLTHEECDLALAGGVNVLLAPEGTIGFCKASMISPDGRCRAFDVRANGFVRSEGAGIVVLKPLARAVDDGDPVYAVIRGTAINQDGRTPGMSVPSSAAQQALLRRVLQEADVAAAAVQYVEAHGTGTPAGDPIEAEAIGRVFSASRSSGDPCVIGSVKTNLGHLEAASGIAGLIKTALALKHRQIPPNLHFTEPNPAIPLVDLGLRIPTRLTPWPATTGAAMAGVNSFGFGGANAHALLQEPPTVDVEPSLAPVAGSHILTLSARSDDALRQLTRDYVAHLADRAAPPFRDVCYTAAVRRSHHEHRLSVVAHTADACADALAAFLSGEPPPAVVAGRCSRRRIPAVAFVFPGMGPQWWGMGQRLMLEEPLFREALEACDRIVRRLAPWSLIEELTADEARSRVSDTRIVQVANCALQIALAALWRAWGIVPDAVIGHSAGEMAAAHVAGALSLEDALVVAFHRGRLLHRATGTGTMLAAAISVEEAEEIVARCRKRVAVGAVNSPMFVTLSGETEALRQIAASLEEQHRFCRFLPTEVPYHGPQMDGIHTDLLHALEGLRPTRPSIPMISTVTGCAADDGPLDASYWWRNIRQPVQFSAGFNQLAADGYDLFVEISPHPALAIAIGECLSHMGRQGTVLPTLRRMEDERAVMLRSLCALHVRGRPIAWSGVYKHGTCVPLPAYPWQRERHWFETTAEAASPPSEEPHAHSGHRLLGCRLRSARPSWEAHLGNSSLAYLAGHRIQGAVVFPAAAYAEMALAAARQLGAAAPIEIQRLEFRRLLAGDTLREAVIQLLYDPRDRSIEIHGAAAAGNESWTCHAAAQLVERAAQSEKASDLAAARARCATAVDVDDWYRSLARRGFEYSGHFHCITELSTGADEAVGRIALPDPDPGADQYEIHPALLDGAFQLLLAAAGSPHTRGRLPDGPILPVSIEHMTFHRRPGQQGWSHVRIRCEPDGVIGDVDVTDSAGRLCVSLEGLRCRPLGAVRPTPSRAREWLYELEWTPTPLAARTTTQPTSAELVDRMQPIVATLERELQWNTFYTDVSPRLNAIACGFIRQALSELGWRTRPAMPSPTDADCDRLGIAPNHRRYFAWLMALLRAAAHGAPDRASADSGGGSLEALCDDVARDHPEWAPAARILARSGPRLAKLLRGDVDVREVLFTPEALVAWRAFFRETPWCRFYNEIAADVVAEIAREFPADRPLRILEVGAGSGGTTIYVLPRLRSANADYLFTDISTLFLAQAREHFAGEPHLRFATLDIERDPGTQDLDAHSFDIVVANDVMHATRDLRSSLGHVRQLLRPGGLLVLIEGTRKEAWLDVNFGGIEGWWRFADVHVRPSHAFLSEPEWRRVLEDGGFADVVSLADPPREGGTLASVVLARANASESTQEPRLAGDARQWIFYADYGGIAERLALAVRARGDRCALVFRGDRYRHSEPDIFEIAPHETADATRMLQELSAPTTAVHGIVYLWNLDAPVSSTLTTDRLMAWQRIGGGGILAALRALDALQHPMPHVWLVTSGAQPLEGTPEPLQLAQSPLWGLGRVLINEHAGSRCRMVDLGPQPDSTEVAALVEELFCDSATEEVALRGRDRFTRRLRRATPTPTSAEDVNTSPEEVRFRVDVAAPGALDSLRLRETPERPPGPGQVAIRVLAAGLNFKDVLLALDMLPANAFSGEWAGRRFGIECAGVVTACGSGVDAFARGDEVIAIAPAAFGSHVIARVDLTVAKPASLTFEEAASVPIPFLTAHYALNHVAGLTRGERVLIHAATGGVGLAAIQIARRAGAEIFATAGTPEKRAYLRSLGLTHIFDSRTSEFADEILLATGGEGVDVILNSLVGDAIAKGLGILRANGRFVEIGKREVYGQSPPLPLGQRYVFFDLLQGALDRPVDRSALGAIVDQVANGTLELLPRTEFDIADVEPAFRLMSQAKHIGKIVLSVRQPEYRVARRSIDPVARPDATYLITGGLGGFGIAVAEWLIRKGAGCVVLMSRTGVPLDGEEALERLRHSGALVVVMQGDVSVPDDVARVTRAIRDTMPPLRGVVHAAMVLDDDTLVRLDDERFERVLAPKVAGAWNLHTNTLGDDLDFFVLFSSLASVVGTPLQGNYAAANAFLDALAPHRRALGLPALTIGWGALAGVGYVARHAKIGAHLDRLGFGGLDSSEALDTLESLLHRSAAHVIAARIDWSKWQQWNRTVTAVKPFLSLAAQEPAHVDRSSGEATTSIVERLRSAEPKTRNRALEDFVIGKVARVLATTTRKVDPERPLTEMGFDSLMAVELMSILHRELGVQIPVTRLLEGVTSRQLATTLLAQVGFAGAEPGPDLSADDTGPRAARMIRPLSFEQRRLWLLNRWNPGNPAYNMPAAARLSGRLDVALLEESLSEIARRHDLLRATFTLVDGEPVQVIAPPAPVVLECIDLHATSPNERDAEMHRCLSRQAQARFDLNTGPLLRGTLLRLDEHEHVVLLVAHHIVCDAWSRAVLLRELSELYAARIERRASLLPEVRGYQDYVSWQQNRLPPDVRDSQLAYWRGQLGGASVPLRWPMLRERSATLTRRGGRCSLDLSLQLSDAVRELSRTTGATLFMTLLAAFKTLLHRYTGENEITVGTPISTRGLSGNEAVIGCFMNTLAMRTSVAGDPRFLDLLQRVQRVALGAYANQDVPFEQIVEALQPERDSIRSPLFQVLLVLHNLHMPEFRSPYLTVTGVEVDNGAAMFDLTLLVESGECLRLVLDYDADLFDAPSAACLLGQFETLLGSICADPARPLSALRLTSAAEERQLADWNDTAAELGSACLHELFEAQARRNPTSVAVVSGDQSRTYAELDREANRIADDLRERGVGPDVIVGVCLERSIDLVVALLGVLKAGGAFLPLNTTTPTPRIQFMLADARVRTVISRRALFGRDTEVTDYVVLGEPDDGVAGRSPATERSPATASNGVSSENLAYVMYTSGSSGEPKGVLIEHRAICNQVGWRQRTYAICGADVVLQLTGCDFDPSVWEIFGALAAGATLVMAPPGAQADTAALVRTIAEGRVTTLQLVPSLLDALLLEPGLERCSALLRVFCGGEPLGSALRDRFFARLPDVALHHLYGPTEAAIDATSCTCHPGDDGLVVPIGRPIANAQIYILDARLDPVAIGISGEMFIAGDCLARGYLNRPTLTAERFVPDRFSDVPGARMYRTGDRGRWLADGSIQFLGRLDEQVKIRGHRVEPGEIETILRRHPCVRQAEVVFSDLGARGVCLVAYICTDTTAVDLRSRDLRAWMTDRLPDYMVPSAFVVLQELPRLANGKVDRHALAEREWEPTDEVRLPTPPSDEIEHRLVRVWEDLLGTRPIGTDDDFFDIGGHSLLAIRLIACIREAFDEELPAGSILEERTIARMACLLRARTRPDSPLIALQPRGAERPLFCVHALSGTAFPYVELARLFDHERPVYALQARATDAGEPFTRIEDMAASYLGAVRSAQEDGPYLLAGWSMGGLVAVEMARQLEAEGREVALVALLDTWVPGASADGVVNHHALATEFARTLGVDPDRLASWFTDDLWQLGTDKQLESLFELARGANLVPQNLGLAALHGQLRLFAQHLRAAHDHVVTPCAAPLALFTADESPLGGATALADWERIAPQRVTRYRTAGDHDTMLRQPHVRGLSRQLRLALHEAQARQGVMRADMA